MIDIPQQGLAQVCQQVGVQELWVFGSVLREDFRDDSDVDFLVEFKDNDAGPWLCKFGELEEGLSQLLGRTVDVVDRRSVERSENYIRRRHILESARRVYVAG